MTTSKKTPEETPRETPAFGEFTYAQIREVNKQIDANQRVADLEKEAQDIKERQKNLAKEQALAKSNAPKSGVIPARPATTKQAKVVANKEAE